MNPHVTIRTYVVAMAIALVLLPPAILRAQELRGKASIETRMFPTDPVFPDQRGELASPSLTGEPEIIWAFADGRFRLVVRPFVRLDAHDGKRTHVDLREGSLVFFADRWTLQVGVGKVFWGKTEAHHMVDVINQTDAVEDIDGEDKLGQPMINLTLERDWGAVDLFLLPYFRERTFPGADGRLRGRFPVEGAEYESSAGRWHPDFAVRGSFFWGQFDVAVSAFHGTGREPSLAPVPSDGGLRLRPYYSIIDQVSVDAQWTRGATLWKLEAMARSGQGRRFLAAVAGFEHTLFGLGSRGSDLGVLMEVMLDGRDEEAPFTAFDHDLFLGARWSWNDIADTSILGGPVIDYRTGEILAFLEAERRIGDRWVVELQARWLLNTDETAPLHGMRRDDFLNLGLSRYF